MLLSLIEIVISIVILWIGADLAISSVEKFTHRLRARSFAVSFLILGFLTSLSEISLGVNAVLDGEPQMFVGNLIGASIVIMLFIVPLLAIINNGVKLDFGETKHNLPLALVVISMPVFLVLDKTMSNIDAIIIIVLFVVLSFSIQRDKGLLSTIENLENAITKRNTNFFKDILKIFIGSFLIITTSKVIVDNTVVLADTFGISTFVIGLLLLSIGSNIPELSVLFYATLKKKRSIALGDYLGSASFNSFLIGILTVLNQKSIVIESGLKLNLLILPFGALALLILSKGKIVSKKTGWLLMALYLAFVITELFA